MKQVLFYDKGYEKTGKSASIKAVFRELASRVLEEDARILDGSLNDDIKAFVKYRGVMIGIESQGDPNSRLFLSVQDFVEKKYPIIVCACRTKGEDFRGLFNIIQKNEYTEFACPHFCVKDLQEDTYPQLNSEYASHVVRWIDWWIDNYKV